MDDTKKKMILASDSKFELFSENHIFDCLGFANIDEDELPKYIDPELFNFLKNHQSIQAEDDNPSVVADKKSSGEIFSPILI
jgi:hypothetical protein